mmetsp:Transcript_43151/g.101175  ORF Transcript_43151/g.101175 Transcript_43151/m.101175 type:complete len:133 (+) Transcript_43151:452-850(+)
MLLSVRLRANTETPEKNIEPKISSSPRIPKLESLPRGPNVITWDNPANFVSHSLWLKACQEIGETFFYPTNEAGDVISVADLGSNNKKKKKKKIQNRVKNGWGRLKYPLKTEDYLKPNKVCKALYDSWIACG